MAAADGESKAAQADLAEAEAAMRRLPDGAAHDVLVEKLSAESEAARQLHLRAQADLASLDQAANQQRERRAVAQAEIRGWQDRSGEAERRIAEMNKRRVEIAASMEAMAGRPDILAAELTRLEGDKATLADKLAELQVAERNREEALRITRRRTGRRRRSRLLRARTTRRGRGARRKPRCAPPRNGRDFGRTF